MEVHVMVSIQDINVKEKTQWCLGCGDFGILAALKQAIVELNIAPHDVCLVTGVGCGSKIPHYLRTYGYEGLHGRLLPLADGIKLANPTLHVIGIGGDGDGFSEGGNHFIHAARRNTDITYVVQNNYYYSLTTGQTSPTTKKGMKTKTHPGGSPIEEFKPTAMAMMAGATFVAATYAGDIIHCKETLKKAIQHRGFSFVEIYQPCVTWDRNNTYDWYKNHVYDLQKDGFTDTGDFDKSLAKALEPFRNNFSKVPIGVFYEIQKTNFQDIYPVLKKGPLAKQDLMKRNLDKDFRQLM
jgi:2-oxoglutarate ferredoxin oxidoreductase subunit beta